MWVLHQRGTAKCLLNPLLYYVEKDLCNFSLCVKRPAFDRRSFLELQKEE